MTLLPQSQSNRLKRYKKDFLIPEKPTPWLCQGFLFRLHLPRDTL